MQTKNQTNLLRNTIFIIVVLFSRIHNINAQVSSGTSDHLKYSVGYKDEKSFEFKGFSLKGGESVIESKIKFPEIDGKRVEFEEMICISDKIYLFTSLYNKKDKIYSAYVNEISLDGILNPKCIQIDEILNCTKNNTGYFTFNLSSDSSSILAYHAHDEDIRGEMIGKIFYKTLDKYLATTSTNEFELSRSFNYCSALNRKLIDNHNLVYLEKNYIMVKGEKRQYNACLYNSKEKKLYKTAIMADEKYILDINIEMSNNEQLLCSGIYGIDKSFGDNWEDIRCLKGAFYYLFDKNNLSIISHNNKDIQASLANDKLYRFHLTSSYVGNEKVNVTCQFQNLVLTSFISDDTKTYKKVYGQFISTTFDLKDKANILVKVSEK